MTTTPVHGFSAIEPAANHQSWSADCMKSWIAAASARSVANFEINGLTKAGTCAASLLKKSSLEGDPEF